MLADGVAGIRQTPGREARFHALVDGIQSLFPDVGSQLVGTVLALLLLVLVVEVVRRAGPHLKERLGGPLVETAQATLLAILTALVGGFLVVVWRATGQVVAVLALLEVDKTDVIRLVFTVAILVGAYSLTRVTKATFHRLARERGAVSEHQQEIAHHVVQLAIYVVAGFVVLGLWSVKLGGLLVGASVITIVAGLAARQTLGAVVAGFVVLFSRPFEMGDWVQIAGREGVVTDITVFNTEIRTFDDEYVLIPNDEVTSTEIVNRSRKGRLRLSTDVGVDYGADVERAMEVAAETMADVDILIENPGPHVVLAEFGDSSVVLRLRYYIDDPSARKMWKARTEVVAAVKAAFEREDVEIPFPQRELTARPGSTFRVGRDGAGNDGVEGREGGGADGSDVDPAVDADPGEDES